MRFLAFAILATSCLAALQCGSSFLNTRSRRSSFLNIRSRRSGIPIAEVDASTTAASLMDLLNQPPIIINRIEVLDPDKGILTPPSGVTVTASGYLGLFVVALQQLFAPWGWVQYSQRIKDDEQYWLDAGKSPEQAVINAYQNVRPPKDTPEEDAADEITPSVDDVEKR